MKFLLNIKDDPIIDALIKGSDERVEAFENQAEFHLAALRKLKKAADEDSEVHWKKVTKRLRELGKLPADYDTAPYKITINDDSQILIGHHDGAPGLGDILNNILGR